MKRSVAFILAALLSLNGCSLGPNYMRAEQPFGATYYRPVRSGESVANLPWWNVFTDPVLQNLIRQSLNENKDLKVAVARIEQARAILGFTRADQFPRIDVSGSAQRVQSSDNVLSTGRQPFNNFGVFGDLTFELDIWGKLRRATEAEEATLLSTEYAERAIVISLVAQVASAYFKILGIEDRLAISDVTIKNRKSNTDLIQARFSKGMVPELDLNQAQIEEASARADKTDFERDLKQTEHALAILLGKVPGDIPRGHPLVLQSLRDDLPTGFPAELLQRRPDVLSAEEALRSEVARIGVAEANRLPTITLLGFVGLNSEKTSNLVDANSFTWSIGGNLLGPLIDFGKYKSAVEAQEANAKAALSFYEGAVIQAVREVEDSIVAIQTLKESLYQRELQAKAARNASRLSHARYDEGVTSYLEVLDIERSLFQAELSASLDRENYLKSIVQLFKALGGGWKEVEQSNTLIPR